MSLKLLVYNAYLYCFGPRMMIPIRRSCTV